MIKLESGERGYICRDCMRFVPEGQAQCQCKATCSVCGGYGKVRAECGPPYFMIPCWGCKSERSGC